MAKKNFRDGGGGARREGMTPREAVRQPLAMQLMMADVTEALEHHRANALDLLVCGRQLLVSALASLVEQNPAADHEALCSGIVRQTEQALRQRLAEIRGGTAPSAEA